jgi:hypothetical protein
MVDTPTAGGTSLPRWSSHVLEAVLPVPALRRKVQPPVEIFHGDGDIDFAIMDRSL